MPLKPESEHKAFKAYEPGYVHVDVKYLPQMEDEDKRRYAFVAIDRATRWAFIAIKQHKTGQCPPKSSWPLYAKLRRSRFALS